ncbi:MAG: GIY-YIG nuclease family protein [Anaerolineales bacterium]
MPAQQSQPYYVYILGNDKGALYTGVTNDILRRVVEHRKKELKDFTKKYDIDQLLFCEEFTSIVDAIEAEKRIKGWTRKKKLELIRTVNPTFSDLTANWLESQ